MCVCVCVWNYIHALVCGSQSRKWPGCTEFQISLMACSLAGNSSCPLVCPCHLLWRGGTCGWEEGDPLILRSFRLTLWFTRKWKKYIVFPSLKLHGAILPPKKHLSALLPLNVAPYGALWLQTYPFGGSPAWLSVLALRHDIMPGWRQAGRGYGYNQMSLHCVCQRSLRCFHM